MPPSRPQEVPIFTFDVNEDIRDEIEILTSDVFFGQ